MLITFARASPSRPFSVVFRTFWYFRSSHSISSRITDLTNSHLNALISASGRLTMLVSIQTASDALRAVSENGMNLRSVPHEIQTEAICRAAILQCGRALEAVRSDLITRELCLEAVDQYPSVLQEVPNALRDYEICLLAVRKSGYLLGAVPESLKTNELLEAAFLENPASLVCVTQQRLFTFLGSLDTTQDDFIRYLATSASLTLLSNETSTDVLVGGDWHGILSTIEAEQISRTMKSVIAVLTPAASTPSTESVGSRSRKSSGYV